MSFESEWTCRRIAGESGRDISERKQAEREIQQLSIRFLGLQDEGTPRASLESCTTSLRRISLPLRRAGSGRARSSYRQTSGKLWQNARRWCEQSLKEVRTLSYLLHPPCWIMLDWFRPCNGTSTIYPTQRY
jgi:hypothetical protein